MNEHLAHTLCAILALAGGYAWLHIIIAIAGSIA